jgi:hypothetical protein
MVGRLTTVSSLVDRRRIESPMKQRRHGEDLQQLVVADGAGYARIVRCWVPEHPEVPSAEVGEAILLVTIGFSRRPIDGNARSRPLTGDKSGIDQTCTITADTSH